MEMLFRLVGCVLREVTVNRVAPGEPSMRRELKQCRLPGSVCGSANREMPRYCRGRLGESGHMGLRGRGR